MGNRRLLQNAEAVKALAEKLSRCNQVTRHNSEQEPQAWTLAHAFADLEESLHRILDEQLPRLVQEPLDDSSINNLLLEIGEEFRHILYHIKDPKFFQYLRDESGEK